MNKRRIKCHLEIEITNLGNTTSFLALGNPNWFFSPFWHISPPILPYCQEVPEKTKESPGGPWTFCGLLPLFDPPRHDSAETIRRALNLGVAVKMITGNLSWHIKGLLTYTYTKSSIVVYLRYFTHACFVCDTHHWLIKTCDYHVFQLKL